MTNPASPASAGERRKAAKDRRVNTGDRRNEERLADDPVPRRNPERPDRRGRS